VLAQAAQMQALRRAFSGTRSSRLGAKLVCAHQQGWRVAPGAGAPVIGQPLGPPHRGQREGSMGVFIRVVFCAMRSRICAAQTFNLETAVDRLFIFIKPHEH
jgi:hypothetical protein